MIRDDSVCGYVNCVGCVPDCVGRTLPGGGGDCPVGMLSSEPLCAITDDKIPEYPCLGSVDSSLGMFVCHT